MRVLPSHTPTPTFEETCWNCGESTESLTGYCDYCRDLGYHMRRTPFS